MSPWHQDSLFSTIPQSDNSSSVPINRRDYCAKSYITTTRSAYLNAQSAPPTEDGVPNGNTTQCKRREGRSSRHFVPDVDTVISNGDTASSPASADPPTSQNSLKSSLKTGPPTSNNSRRHKSTKQTSKKSVDFSSQLTLSVNEDPFTSSITAFLSSLKTAPTDIQTLASARNTAKQYRDRQSKYKHLKPYKDFEADMSKTCESAATEATESVQSLWEGYETAGSWGSVQDSTINSGMSSLLTYELAMQKSAELLKANTDANSATTAREHTTIGPSKKTRAAKASDATSVGSVASFKRTGKSSAGRASSHRSGKGRKKSSKGGRRRSKRV
jgi:hypothetical protein